MPDKTRDEELVGNCIDFADTVSRRCVAKDICDKSKHRSRAPGYEDSIINRICLNGDFSKTEILQTAMRFNGSRPAILDFEDCSTLDQKCLKLVFRWLYRPKVVHLKGTLINKNSKYLKGLNKNRKSEDRIRFLFEPKVMSRERKLERENKQLLKENASLKKQIDEMKNKM